MASTYTAREMCTSALEKVGIISPYETSAPEGVVQKCLRYLDMILSFRTGTRRLWFFVPAASQVTWPADQGSYDLTGALASNPLDLYRAAYVDDSTDAPIELVRRAEFEESRNDTAAGTASPDMIYIQDDGDGTYTGHIRPVPSEAKAIRFVGQKLSPSVATAVGEAVETDHGYGAPWQLWMLYALAIEIGDGPIAKLDGSRLGAWRKVEKDLWGRLESYRADEQIPRVRFTKPYN